MDSRWSALADYLPSTVYHLPSTTKMLKGILQIILTVVGGYFAQLYFPFWSLAAAAALIGILFKYNNSLTSFAAGFIGAFLLWCAFAYTLDSENLGVLSSKLGRLFQTDGSYLPYASGIIGGLLGGFGALTGSLARKFF